MFTLHAPSCMACFYSVPVSCYSIPVMVTFHTSNAFTSCSIHQQSHYYYIKRGRESIELRINNIVSLTSVWRVNDF